MKLLRLLLELGKTALGIDVYGILCDLALHMKLLAQACAVAEVGASLKLSMRSTFSAWVVDVRC